MPQQSELVSYFLRIICQLFQALDDGHSLGRLFELYQPDTLPEETVKARPEGNAGGPRDGLLRFRCFDVYHRKKAASKGYFQVNQYSNAARLEFRDSVWPASCPDGCV